MGLEPTRPLRTAGWKPTASASSAISAQKGPAAGRRSGRPSPTATGIDFNIKPPDPARPSFQPLASRLSKIEESVNPRARRRRVATEDGRGRAARPGTIRQPRRAPPLARRPQPLDFGSPTCSSRSENDLGFSVHFQQPGEKRVDPGEVCALLAAIKQPPGAPPPAPLPKRAPRGTAGTAPTAAGPRSRAPGGPGRGRGTRRGRRRAKSSRVPAMTIAGHHDRPLAAYRGGRAVRPQLAREVVAAT